MGPRDVTIIIPYHCPDNTAETWAIQAIDSALATGANVAVWDDGSPLPFSRVASRYIREIEEIGRLRHQRGPNRGPSVARNAAVSVLTSTEFIFPLDCDDTVHKDAIMLLLGHWDGRPVYPDLRLMDKEGRPAEVHQFKEFNCEYLYDELGAASVSVLHTVRQWESVGGWDENVTIFEDAWYNIMLMTLHCGRRFNGALVNYRRHEQQRSGKRGPEIANYMRTLLNRARTEYKPMCCGKNKQVQAAASAGTATRSLSVNMEQALPEGGVTARYKGGYGKGRHYYKGRVTKFPYHVKFGEAVTGVDPRDVDAAGSLFEYMEEQDIAASPREPRADVPEKEPVANPLLVETKADTDIAVPDMEKLKVSSLRTMIASGTVDATLAQLMLTAENEKDKPRKSVVGMLEEVIAG